MSQKFAEFSFRLLSRLYPVRPLGPTETPLSDEERRIYRRLEAWSLLPLYLMVAALTYPWFLALKWGAGSFPQDTPDDLILLRPPPQTWLIPAMLLGMISSVILTSALYVALLGSRYRRFERSCNERVGFTRSRGIALLSVLALGSVAFFAVVVMNFARFTESGVEIGRAIPPGRTFYGYARVRSVEDRLSFRAPLGTTVHKPHYVVTFDDGSAWYSNGILFTPLEKAERIARMVARRSGRRIAERP